MLKTYNDKANIDGMENNPHPDISKPPEMPLGLGMSLCMNREAFDYYCTLDSSTKNRIIENVTCCETGEQAKKKIKQAVKALGEHDTGFLG